MLSFPQNGRITVPVLGDGSAMPFLLWTLDCCQQPHPPLPGHSAALCETMRNWQVQWTRWARHGTQGWSPGCKGCEAQWATGLRQSHVCTRTQDSPDSRPTLERPCAHDTTLGDGTQSSGRGRCGSPVMWLGNRPARSRDRTAQCVTLVPGMA